VQTKWTTIAPVFLALLGGAKPTLAQPTTDTQQEAIRKLNARIDELQAQVAQIRSQLDALVGANVPETGAIESRPTPPAALQPSPERQLEGAGRATREHHTFAEDEEDAPRLDNVPLERTYPGFFYLPGTQTMLRIDGFARTEFIVDPTVSGLPDAFIPSFIPIPARGPAQFAASIRASRISADLRTPVGDRGSARAFIQLDFFGPDGTTAPRLRHFYGQLDNILVGQTFTNFMDPDAFPDTLDTQGVNAGINARIPQARYSAGLGKGWSGYFSIEQPFTNVAFPIHATPVEPLTRAPDGSIRLRKEWEGGHFQVATIFRDLSLRLPHGGPVQSVFGWGVNVTGGAEVFGRDNVVLGMAYGHGISRYAGDTAVLGLDAAPRSQTNLSLRSLPLFATYGSYQHFWTPVLRSNANFGFVQVQNTTFQAGNTYHNSIYSSANLIWNPVGSLDFGAEFIYGWVQNKNGETANAPRIQFTGRYRFVNHEER